MQNTLNKSNIKIRYNFEIKNIVVAGITKHDISSSVSKPIFCVEIKCGELCFRTSHVKKGITSYVLIPFRLSSNLVEFEPNWPDSFNFDVDSDAILQVFGLVH